MVTSTGRRSCSAFCDRHHCSQWHRCAVSFRVSNQSRFRRMATPTGSSGKQAVKLWAVESHGELLTLQGQGSLFCSSVQPGLRPRSFRQPFTINTTQMLTMCHRRIDTPAQKERGSYPGSTESRRTYPNGVACVGGERGHNPGGVETRFGRYPRVARRLATLGWRTQSLWDCLQWHPGLVRNDKRPGEEREGFFQTHSM